MGAIMKKKSAFLCTLCLWVAGCGNAEQASTSIAAAQVKHEISDKELAEGGFSKELAKSKAHANEIYAARADSYGMEAMHELQNIAKYESSPITKDCISGIASRLHPFHLGRLMNKY